jgi:hypothetical protein
MSSAVGDLANSPGSVSVLQAMFNDEKREVGRDESQAEERLEKINGQRWEQCLNRSATE